MIELIELVVLCVLALGSLGALVYWSVVLFHVVRTIVTIPTARAGAAIPAPADPPRVCVIVPAHNEESCIGELARSLVAQDYPNLGFVFVLDRCTDGTRAALERAWSGAGMPMEIIELSSCPPGWVGKSHALWTGASASRGARDASLFLFVDADTTLDPRLVRSAVGLLGARGARMLSFMSTLTHDRWFECLVQPSAAMELIRQYPITRANAAERRRPFANGQFILIGVEEYRQIGGHEAIRDAVLEDVELARRCEYHGIPTALLLADGMLRCRMYDSFGAFERGWRRIFGEAANRKPSRLRRNATRTWLTGTVLPLAAGAAVPIGLWRALVGDGGASATIAAGATVLGGLGVVVCLVTWGVVYCRGQTPIWAVPGFPVGSALVASIMRNAARDLERGRPTEWGGRIYAREGRA